MLFTPKKLALLMSSLCLLSPLTPVQAAEPAKQVELEKNAKQEGVELAPVVVKGKRNFDAEGHKKVFEENVTNLYIGREELERIQATNPADVLKGVNGVYSMDARNGIAITPNIRGLSGEGRVPLTVDGTEQSTNIWLQLYGVGNRSYVDPAMFRSIAVEKGPSLSRDVKSGVGGSINIRTIEAGDIIPEGASFGAELKLETTGNSAKPQVDANSYFGQDYRSIPGAQLGGWDNNVNVPQPVPRAKGSSTLLNFDDHSEMIAIAARNASTDLLFSYSQRIKGNYFAGTSGIDDYSRNDAYAKDTAAYYPNLNKLYHAGNEVLSTSSENKSWLLKNNWFLPQDNKLTFSLMRSDLNFAETGPGQAIFMLGFAEALAKQGKYDQLVAEFPRSKLQLDTYKLSHEWKPADSRWINLQSNLWMTKTEGERHQSGGGGYYIPPSQALADYGLLTADWTACRSGPNNGPDWSKNLPSGGSPLSCLAEPTLKGEKPAIPDHDGKIFAGSAQWTKHERKGFDVSNVAQLADNLRLTVGGGFQREALDERVAEVKLTGGIGPGGAMLHYGTTHYGPRSGERSEATAMFNVEWEPTSWLSLSAGLRYNRYQAEDTGLAERRRQQIASAQASKRKAGLALRYGVLMSDAEKAKFEELRDAAIAAQANANWDDPAVMKTWDVYYEYSDGKEWDKRDLPTGDPAVKAAHQALVDYVGQHKASSYENMGQAFIGSFDRYTTLLRADGEDHGSQNYSSYWQTEVVLPLVGGKPDASQSPFFQGTLDLEQKVANPQGNTGVFSKIKPAGSNEVYERISADQAWAAPEKQSGEAFSPVFSATIRFSPYSSAFVRHAQTTRFPSLFELASTSTSLLGVGTLSVEGASKPERSINWELGYAHDLTQFLPDLRAADVRLSYFNTVIKDFIEREPSMNVIQFDEKKVSGLEFQSRFDSGAFFGNLGATYRLTQEICDENYAYSLDVFYKRMPKCMTGGFPGMLTATSLQPKYSINSEFGTRLFNNSLEMGLRSVYHAKAENPQLQALLSTNDGQEVWAESSMNQMFWHSVMLHDFYAKVNVHKDLDLNLKISNLTDRYYMDPMSKIPVPGPGRSLSLGLRARF
jgi:hemoglobin/transferrin/lactoferrin receptor protein